jgi:RES domain-containing protein
MSSVISTREELLSSSRPAADRCWRVVEPQHRISTAKLTDSAAEQNLLEEVIEETKPKIPPECEHLHFLLKTPFRYGSPYPNGSRFRRAGYTPGVFYASDNPETAIAEACFHLLLFYNDSPDTKWPSNASEHTIILVEYATERSIDLTRPPFDNRTTAWMHPTRYDKCQELADLARNAGIELIKYMSVRDHRHRSNVALMTCKAFANQNPIGAQSWRILLGSNGARAFCEMPRQMLDFDRKMFDRDPRIAALRWDR